MVTRKDAAATLDLFGNVSVVEPTHTELVAAEIHKIRVDRYCVCGCGRWLIAGEETEVNDGQFFGALSYPCAMVYGYVTPNERKRKR